ncbi:MAG: hypothetical protein ACK58L_15290 [Planctomycetota bacterium]
MNDVKHQHRGLQRLLAAMAVAAILETSGMSLGADEQPARTKSKAAVASGSGAGRAKISSESSDAGWQPRSSSGKWTSGAGKPGQIATGTARQPEQPSRSAKSEPVSRSVRRSPSLIFIAGKSASDDQKTEPSEDVPKPAASEAQPAPAAESAELNGGHGADDGQKQPSAESASEDQSVSGDAHSTSHDSGESNHHSEANEEAPGPKTEPEQPTYFDAPAETMPGLSPEESLDDQPVMSTTERFKQLLIENERLRNEGATGSVIPDDSEHQAPARSQDGGFRSFGAVPSLEEDLNSEDPSRRQRAQRILRIREQILHLKSRARKAESQQAVDSVDRRAAPEHSEKDDHQETTPHSSDPEGTSLPPADLHDAEQHTKDTDAVDVNNEHDSDPHDSHGETGSPEAHDSAHGAHDDQGSTGGHGDEDDHAFDHSGMADSEPHTEEGHEASDSPGRGNASGSLDAAHGLVTIGDSIDRVGLANNLYALGEYPAAHDAYRSVEPEQLTPEQQFWVEYQIANCLRRLGESAAASNQFRKLAAQPEAGWVSEQAAWWVDILEQIRQAEKDLEDDDSQSVPAVREKKLPLSGISTEASHGSHQH